MQRRRVAFVTKQVEQRDRVIIRFAGDSGDGMQLTGDRFTQETAVFGNDLSTLPNFPAEIRAPAGTLAGRLLVPGALRRPRHPDPGRRARGAGRDEPGGTAGERRDLAPGRRSSWIPMTSRPQPGPGRLCLTNPLEDGSLQHVRRPRGRPDRV